jgi:ankyrin repeat protein/catechol 2,3-dioxygenase-like lactoylglutathione lyase family enzyme
MPTLPERPSLEFLKKRARERLQVMRQADPRAKLSAALLAVAHDYKFDSWRALKAEVDRRRETTVTTFFDACARGDLDTLRNLLAADPSLTAASKPGAPYAGWTALHEVVKSTQLEAVRLLLANGADPNAREAGDHTTPMHWAAATGRRDIVEALLDAGGDVHGYGDAHELDVIGWGSFYHGPDDDPARPTQARLEALALLEERGARHHIFSAICLGDLARIQRLVEENPAALDRRMSRFEHGQTALHFALSRKRYDILDLLIELGADLEAEDRNGRTAMAVAMLYGDREAMTRLHAAGAQHEDVAPPADFSSGMQALARTVSKGVTMIKVSDIARSLDWYVSLGFRELERYEANGVVNFGMVSFGGAELMLNMHGSPGRHDASLWFYTDQVDALYRLLKSKQLDAARASLASAPSTPEGIVFEQDVEDMFYGARQFCVRDPDGYELYFIQVEGAHRQVE